MLYKHWKKIAIALTGFFWASCDETASGPVAVNEDTPSTSINENTEGEVASSSSKAKSTASSETAKSAASSETAKSAASSAEAASATSSAKSAAGSSSNSSSEAHSSAAPSTTSAASSETAKSATSSADTTSAGSSADVANAESSADSTASSVSSSSTEPASSAKSSSSVKKPRSSNSHLDEPVDLYGCPSDICGPFITDSISISDSISIIAAKYGVIRPESSSSFSEIIAKYGVPSKPTCEPALSEDGTVTYKCSDGVTCVEETTTGTQAPACNGDVCPKYGVVKISKKTYTCDNGQVYSEAEFQMLYDTLPIIKEDFIHKDSIQLPIALYGSPCVFDGTCSKEK